MSETIQIPFFNVLGATPANTVSFQISFSLTGGTFTLSVLKNSIVLPAEDTVISMPFGRIAIVKNIGHGNSTGGLVDTISGPIQPLAATLISFASVAPGELYTDSGTNGLPGIRLASSVARQLIQGAALGWQLYDPLLKSFVFRGVALSGVQQLAQIILGEVCVNRNTIFISPPGTIVGLPFSVPASDIISSTQNIDFSLDYASELNPALLAANLIPQGTFVYDDAHAQKQGNTQVQAGAPGGTGSKDFIEIPNGWMIDGTFEEWTPISSTNLTNPKSSATGGRYWKVFPSPTSPGMLRGVLSFSRLVRELNLPKNVSTFVGSPVTAQSLGSQDLSRTFMMDQNGTESGIYGFTADETQISDIVSGQVAMTVNNALTLIPSGGEAVGSGDAISNFYGIQIGLWTFPRVNPTTFGVGDPTNPYGVPSNFVIINPPQNVVNLDVSSIFSYYNAYVQNYQKINSPRLKSSVVVPYRNYLPQPGDSLTAAGIDTPGCGRIGTVTLSYSRGGVNLSLQAEVFHFQEGVVDQQLTS